jgi:putative flippase GtrA
VSVASTASTLAVIAFLEDSPHLPGAPAAALATAFGFGVSYTLTRTWTFAGGIKAGHMASLAWLGGLALAGFVLCSLAGWAVDSLTHTLPHGARLAVEEATEAVVLASLFGVRLGISRALFAGGTADAGRQRVPTGVSETREMRLTG